MKNKIIFGENKIEIDDIFAVSNKQKNTSLKNERNYINKINKGAEFLKEKLEKDKVIYGVTTGYGDSCVVNIEEDLHYDLPVHLAKFHGCGLGEHFDKETTRAIIAARITSLALGYSAVRYELLEYLNRLLENDILPLIPKLGSVGASGDLTPLSYIARTLIGEEKVLFKDEVREAKDVFRELKLEPLKLNPKEGLALMNGTAVMTAIAVRNYKRSEYIIKLCSRITAMASIALKGNRFHFDEKLFSLKPHPGQNKIAKWIREDISKEAEKESYDRLQDRYSIRCAPHIIGVLADILPAFKDIIENEINSSNDNPLIDAKNEKIMHGGHFYGGHIAFVMDSMKNAVANLADMMDRQMALLVDEKFNNGLPRNLSGDKSGKKSINHGLKAVQITVSALTAEALKNTMPASVFSRSTECHNQDKVSMGTISSRDCETILDLTEQVAAALIIATTQALSIRINNGEIEKSNLTSDLLAFYDDITTNVDFLEQDRPLEKDLRKLAKNIKNQKWKIYE